MRAALFFALAVAACADPSSDGSCPGGIAVSTCYATVTNECRAGVAQSLIRTQESQTPCTVCEPADDVVHRATCAGGCAVEVEMPWLPTYAAIANPAILCADTPEAKAGDACSYQAGDCLPTRARLAADGTVAAQEYLSCDGHACVAAAPPIVADYLKPCPIVDDYRTPGLVGVLYGTGGSCLLAWDAAAGVMRSGQTIECAGDWACPGGSLCDDQIADATGGATR